MPEEKRTPEQEQALKEKAALIHDPEWVAKYRKNGSQGPEGQKMPTLDKLILGIKE
jgi:hypothetical protein